MSQWYAYVPGAPIVTVACPPPSMWPVSNPPRSAVAVCTALSALVMVIVVPALTWIGVGENAKFLMVMAFGRVRAAISEPGSEVTDRVITTATAATRGTNSAYRTEGIRPTPGECTDARYLGPQTAAARRV